MNRQNAARPKRAKRHFYVVYRTELLLLSALFASLICNTAGGLASGLARGLAFAAAAVLCRSAEIAGVDGLNSLHNRFSLSEIRFAL
jgi:hypothetical protein